MSDVEKNVTISDPIADAPDRACTMSLDEHLELLSDAMTIFGLGVACSTEVQALLVMAEVGRRVHGHTTFDPGPKAEELIEAARLYRAKQRADIETAQETGIVH